MEPQPDLDGPGALQRLQQEEQALSARRTRLHDRIDFVRSGGSGGGAESAHLLQELERKERELSQRRRALHEQIDALSRQILGASAAD